MLSIRHALCVLLVCTLVSPLGQPRSTAVVDRFEGDRAVLATDGDETVVLARERLPREGRHVDAVFRLSLAHGAVTSLTYDAVATRYRGSRARSRFDRLSRPLGSRYGTGGNQS
ncbi:DUF3006 domain-containing protein [Halomarina salina]|uniref:DUF3006 domain-containing protein n=1 Tax=Halomarina salina TaxID=1872699 RepID=A0ABD5RQW1_9EURY